MSERVERRSHWDVFDKILVLSLRDSEDRREHIRNEFKKVGIERYEFFDASHYASDEVKEFKNSDKVLKAAICFRCLKRRCLCENNYLTDFQIANWHSFIRLWKHILDNGYKFTLICEDDIVFTPHHKGTIFNLLTKREFNKYHISLNKPLLIGLGGAYHPQKHFLKVNPHFKAQNVMCNPCFCVNLPMVKIFLDNYHVHHTSDHYMHVEIPQRFPFVQHLLMYPWPVYELSFVPSMMKFESLVRPKGQSRRIEYKDFLFLSPCYSYIQFFNNLLTIVGIPIIEDNTVKSSHQYKNYYGYYTDFIFKNEEITKKVKFMTVNMYTMGRENDIMIIEKDLENKESLRFYKTLLTKFGLNPGDIEKRENIILLYDKFVEYINSLYRVNMIDINDGGEEKYRDIISVGRVRDKKVINIINSIRIDFIKKMTEKMMLMTN